MSQTISSSQQLVRAQKRKQEKRTIREYKELLSELRDVRDVDNIDEGASLVAQHIERSKFLYPKIQRRAEAVALDALHTKKVAQLGSRLSNKIVIEQRPFETSDFLNNLNKYMKNLDTKFNIDSAIVKFGAEVSNCFLIAPSFDYMYGALSQKGLVKKSLREKKQRQQTTNEESKITIKASERDFETEITKDATPKEVEKIYKELHRTVRKKKVNQVDYFPLTVDPTSFSKTVENIFHSSFLTKEGKVTLKSVGERKEPIICLVKPEAVEQSDNDIDEQRNAYTRTSEYHQTILSFNMKDWKAWIDQYNIKSAALKS